MSGNKVKVVDADTLKAIGYRLGQRRQEAGISRAILGYETGISEAQLGRIEDGRSGPSAVYISRAAQRLGVTTEYLIDGTEPKDRDVEPEDKRIDRLWREYGQRFEYSAEVPLDLKRKRRILVATGLLYCGTNLWQKLIKNEDVNFLVKKEILDALGLWKE